MLIWLAFAAMTAAVIGVIVRPLLAPAAAPAPVLTPADIYRAQLKELEAELAAGRVARPDYEAARAEVGRRLIKASEEGHGEAALQPATSARARLPLAALAVAIGVPTIALLVYLQVGSPHLPDQPLVSRGPEVHQAREFDRLSRLLEAKLNAGQGDAAGWVLLGQAKMQLGRAREAAQAFRRAIAMLDAEKQTVPADLHLTLAQALIAAEGQTTRQAEEALRAALAVEPKSVGARFLLAQALAERGDLTGAIDGLEALLKDTPADVPWHAMLKSRIGQLKDQLAARSSAAGAGGSSPQ
jgi:cytochrome c-type biogenesis protein CcmH